MNKYNHGRKLLKRMGIRPANWLAETVYNHLRANGFEWRGGGVGWDRTERAMRAAGGPVKSVSGGAYILHTGEKL